MEHETRWWNSPLDAQRLACESVGAAVAAVRDVVRARGLRCEVTSTDGLVRSAFETVGLLRVDGRSMTPWAEFSGFFAAADGDVRLHGNYPHHAAAIRRALGVDTRDDLVAAVAGRPAADVEEAVVAAGGVGVRVRTRREWEAHPQAVETDDDPWLSVEPTGTHEDTTTAASASVLPLAGLRVLDLTRVIAGPTCTEMLACLGADVLRIDPPGRPELQDQYLSNGMGKRSAEADLRERADDVKTLVAKADVVVLGYRPGSLTRFDLDPEALATAYPDIVVASLSAWGEHGPWGGRQGFDSIVQAACGIADVCADADGRPGALPVQALDFSTGYMLASGILGLVAQGRGGIVRASLLGAARTLLGYGPAAKPEASEGEFEPRVVSVPASGSVITLPPPPLRLDGRTLELPIGGYGRARLGWA